MTRTSRIRAIIWIGVVADGAVAAALLSPTLLARVLRLPRPPDLIETRTALGLAVALMAGWTVLLLWAARHPAERRGVLLLTVVPVIAGLALAVLYGWWSDYIPTAPVTAVWLLQAGLAAAFLWAYRAAGRPA
jgi:hypothetical protein